LDVWSAIQFVGSGLTLVAFVAAVLLYSYKAKLRQRAEIIRSAPAAKRVEAINATAEIFQIDLTGVSAKDRAALVERQIDIRARRQEMLFRVALLVTVCLAAIALVAIVKENFVHASEVGAPRVSVEAKYQLCIGGYRTESCPPDSIFLPCGSSPADWALEKCAEFTSERLWSRSGGQCGWAFVEITCKTSL
jgi:hypothetical protein